MSYLFLSYAKADRDSADSIKSLLKKAGCAVWMDENRRELAKEQWPLVEEAILKSRAYILLLSPEAKKSSWIKREITYAESIQKPIIPILIAGKEWARLSMPVETLELSAGLSLDLSDSLKETLKALQLSPSSLDMPALVPDASQSYKRERAKQSFFLSLGLLAALSIFSLLFVQPFMKKMNDEAAAIRQTDNLLATQFKITQTAYSIAFTQIILDITATEQNRVNLDAVSGTRSFEMAQTRMSGNSATATQQYQFNETAIAGGGELPCTATVLVNDYNIARIVIYREASLSSPSSIQARGRNSAEAYIVTQWIVNEEGVWYRIGTENILALGYVLAEGLLLDETCPR